MRNKCEIWLEITNRAFFLQRWKTQKKIQAILTKTKEAEKMPFVFLTQYSVCWGHLHTSLFRTITDSSTLEGSFSQGTQAQSSSGPEGMRVQLLHHFANKTCLRDSGLPLLGHLVMGTGGMASFLSCGCGGCPSVATLPSPILRIQ